VQNSGDSQIITTFDWISFRDWPEMKAVAIKATKETHS
jgi:hypothetical protein